MLASTLAALLAWPLEGRTNRQSTIDEYCRGLRQEFREMQPYYFSGPEPWAPLDELPSYFVDAALATVYMEGTKVQWLVLDMNGAGDEKLGGGWYETVNYYFDSEGKVAKRERHFEQAAANTVIDEERYYQNGKRWKDRLVHHRLAKGSEDWSQLFDPDAPEYLNTRDLPFPAVAARERLARNGDIGTPPSARRTLVTDEKLLQR